jgi:hypothetical protein
MPTDADIAACCLRHTLAAVSASRLAEALTRVGNFKDCCSSSWLAGAAEVQLGTEEPGRGVLFKLAHHRRHRQKAGSHFNAFQSLLIRMPMRNTTKSPSISAVTRLSMIAVIATPFPYRTLIVPPLHDARRRGHAAGRAPLDSRVGENPRLLSHCGSLGPSTHVAALAQADAAPENPKTHTHAGTSRVEPTEVNANRFALLPGGRVVLVGKPAEE